MVACVSSDASEAAETQNTLQYAARAARIRNFPRINYWKEKLDPKQYAFLERRLVELERELEVRGGCLTLFLRVLISLALYQKVDTMRDDYELRLRKLADGVDIFAYDQEIAQLKERVMSLLGELHKLRDEKVCTVKERSKAAWH